MIRLTWVALSICPLDYRDGRPLPGLTLDIEFVDKPSGARYARAKTLSSGPSVFHGQLDIVDPWPRVGKREADSVVPTLRHDLDPDLSAFGIVQHIPDELAGSRDQLGLIDQTHFDANGIFAHPVTEWNHILLPDDLHFIF